MSKAKSSSFWLPDSFCLPADKGADPYQSVLIWAARRQILPKHNSMSSWGLFLLWCGVSCTPGVPSEGDLSLGDRQPSTHATRRQQALKGPVSLWSISQKTSNVCSVSNNETPHCNLHLVVCSWSWESWGNFPVVIQSSFTRTQIHCNLHPVSD